MECKLKEGAPGPFCVSARLAVDRQAAPAAGAAGARVLGL